MQPWGETAVRTEARLGECPLLEEPQEGCEDVGLVLVHQPLLAGRYRQRGTGATHTLYLGKDGIVPGYGR